MAGLLDPREGDGSYVEKAHASVAGLLGGAAALNAASQPQENLQ